MVVILYGIKNCDTVKKARRWLELQHISYRFHDYRVDGLSDTLLSQFIDRLGWEQLLNRRSSSWRQLSDADKTGLNAQAARRLMQQQPTLIKRPILDTGTELIIGFSAERYRDVL